MRSEQIIFWDFDGTLGFRPEGWRGVLAGLILEQDPDCGITGDTIWPFLQEGFPWHLPDVPHPELSDPDRWWQHIEPVMAQAYERAGVSAQRSWELAGKVRARYTDPQGFVLFDDTIPVLTELAQRGWRHRIISNHVPELRNILSALGLTQIVEHITNSAEMGYEKPHPEIYRAALAAAGYVPSTAMAPLWMVGDNFVADVLGAERAGLRGILVRKHDPRARWNCADLYAAMAVIHGTAPP